jgi:hypothetical protein
MGRTVGLEALEKIEVSALILGPNFSFLSVQPAGCGHFVIHNLLFCGDYVKESC